MAALHYFAQGSYQKSVEQDLNCALSQSSVSRAITLISDILVQHFSHKVQFPGTAEEKDRERVKFMQHQNGFPGIIGCIDGTHIAIQAPPTNNYEFPGLLFYNRKVSWISARLSIWSTSIIRNHLKQNFINGDESSWLIGDSGYPLEPFNEHELRFNNQLRCVRNTVERAIGTFKSRFRCLLKHRTMHYNPTRAATIINACAILHNIQCGLK
ncbi:hypothetical protein NQ315_011200 [Exocentrus adspersus]|uniref:DDE Tnp4 domain-containing protein n=1 Tax=Exocentrus adspersus TaxID=1586481 RepID=A0AAV8V609_9CUCU|nr:hypothetical protein NQ315_011200 [Exocentrus adspersus]